ncbi:unnamed protein product [Caenorhabditis bovis]|uniref:L-Fucosyltransferase n=1 Tax=Caenorhabditis bovis TaxID=2654633 RepID=A0A8S1F3G5_9PELO|nr:unnamed protein product [Caenorhabditis bovis]
MSRHLMANPLQCRDDRRGNARDYRATPRGQVSTRIIVSNSISASRYSTYTLFIIFATIILFQTTKRDDTNLETKTVYGKTQIFPQGGQEVTLENVKWNIEPIQNIIRNIEELDGAKRYLTSDFDYSNGMGNQMFQFAALFTLAEKHNATLIAPDDLVLRRAFSFNNQKNVQFASRSVIAELSEQMNSLKFTQNVKSFMEDVGVSLAIRSGIVIDTNVANDDQTIQVDPKDALANTMTVGIHVRHGIDIAMNSRNQRHGHVAAPISYYKNAMKQISEIYESVAFIICTDDIYWVRRYLRPDKNSKYYYCPGPREVDMAILASCDTIIMSTGTFSWWSAYLNINASPNVYYYKHWPREGSAMERMLNKSEYFLPNWVALE